MALSRPLDSSLLVASTAERTFCRFCAKESVGSAFLDMQSNEEYYQTIVERLAYMNIKPARKFHMNICQPCFRSFKDAYKFCQTFNNTQILLANLYSREENADVDNCRRPPSKRTINIKVEPESSDELDIENVDEIPPVNKKKKQVIDHTKSWSSYIWTCCHCDDNFEDLVKLRSHSKKEHGTCFGFECPDCDIILNDYTQFIEHVRRHKENLRFYCDVCNDPIEANRRHNHVAGKAMCRYCGELFPTAKLRTYHQQTYKKREIGTEFYIITIPDLQGEKVIPKCDAYQSWDDYIWACKECDIKFHSTKAIRDHGKVVHETCFTMKCLDCNATANTFHTLVLHIMRHRPSLRHFCPFCNRLAHTEDLFREHIRAHLTNSSYCLECGQNYPERIAEIDKTSPTSELWFLEPSGENRGEPTAKKVNDHIKFEDEDNGEMKLEGANFKEERDTSNAEALVDDATLGTESPKLLSSKEFNLPYPTTCGYCDETFTDKRLCREHTSTRFCPICDKSFNCSELSEEHLLYDHMGDKPYECFKCGKLYLHRDSAHVCMETHIAEETVMCKVCRTMVLAPFLMEHVEAHNYDCAALPQVCGVGYCRKKFTSWMDRVNHRYAKHLTITYRKVKGGGRYLAQCKLGLLLENENDA